MTQRIHVHTPFLNNVPEYEEKLVFSQYVFMKLFDGLVTSAECVNYPIIKDLKVYFGKESRALSRDVRKLCRAYDREMRGLNEK